MIWPAPEPTSLVRLPAGLRAALALTVNVAVATTVQHSLLWTLISGFTTVITFQAIGPATRRQEFLALATGACLMLAVFALVALLTTAPLASRVGVLALIHAAVWARQYGPLAHASGIFAFMAYFVGLFLGVGEGDLVQVCTAVALAVASSALARALIPAPVPGAPAIRTTPGSEDDRPSPAVASIRPITPFQVSAAAAAAVATADLVAPLLWYWAVATVWVVFIDVREPADLVSRTGQRLVGTVAGAAGGYALAAPALGNSLILLTLLIVCVFAMFWTPTEKYWLVTFFVTVSLALVLGLRGRLTAHIMVFRVVETIIGAGCGIALTVLVPACLSLAGIGIARCGYRRRGGGL